jgi:hypothetical protein
MVWMPAGPRAHRLQEALASGSWPADVSPASRRDWEEAAKRFRRGLGTLERDWRGATLSSGRGDLVRAAGP